MSFRTKITAVLLATAGLLPFAQAEIPVIEGFTTTWSDDFNGEANMLPNSAEWEFREGTNYPGGAPNWGTWEIETMTSKLENVALTGDGNVAITAIKDPAGAWTSARMETVRTDFACAPGKKMRIQGRLSLPNMGEAGVGYWPAFWALGSTFRGNYTNWPMAGELDVMENVNAQNIVHGSMHCGVYGIGPCNEPTGLTGNTVPVGPPAQGNFHVYTMEVDRTDPALEVIRWFLNDVKYWEVASNNPGMDPAAWADAIHTSYFVILNTAIGGTFPDKVYGGKTPLETTASGGKYVIDYVAVYNSV